MVGADAVVTGIFGFITGATVMGSRRKRKPNKIRPMCGCKHDLSFHNSVSKICHGVAREPTRFDSMGTVIEYKMVKCTCQHYVGPEPLSEYYAPELATEES